MASLPPEDVLPILVADLEDEDARDVLDAAAFTGGRVFVPLETAPVTAAEHVLEVTVPGAREPIAYLATPLGPPTAEGFPLRIQSLDKKLGPQLRAAAVVSRPATRDVVKSKRPSVRIETLSAAQIADLGLGSLSVAAEESLVGRSFAGGKLLIEGLIGRGGVGSVYRARHRELKMPIAVKVLNESFQHDLDFCRRFYAEALAASRLDHANVTRVIDFGQEPTGQLYFAMEYLDGVELRVVLEKERVLPLQRIVDTMAQVCAGLSHAHARGIVHRDIKPENLVLVAGHDDDGEPIEFVKVCDFGIAQQRALPGTKDQDGYIAGTPEYMSPEQCRGEELDARSDLYACGIVLYEMATGQVPFTADRPESILNKHQFTPLLPPSKIEPSIDPRLEVIIMKALEKEPSARYQNMRELRVALRELLTGTDASPPPMSVREVSPQPARNVAPAGAAAQAPSLAGDDLADVISANPAAWVRELSSATDQRVFARLESALRSLAARGDVRALWAVTSTLANMTGPRGEAAAHVLRVYQDPNVHTPIAEQWLSAASDEMREYAKRLVTYGGSAGAYGLYGARVKLALDPSVRGPFTTALSELGSPAWPVVRAALEKILSSEPNAATWELAEDLLLAAPLVGSDQAGHIVTKYLRVNVSGVCRAATASILKLWGDRAKPLLVGMLQSKDDVVRIAGIAGLRQIDAIDEHVLPRLHVILTKRVPASDELRAAAAVALAHTKATARQPAVSLLMQLVTPPRDKPLERPNRAATNPGMLTRDDAVLLALARSLLTIGGPTYRGLVAERAERSQEPLRAQLRRLLG